MGTSVAGQADYPLPAALDHDSGERILEVFIGNNSYDEGSAEQGRNLNAGSLFLRGTGIYWISFNAAGDELLSFYPAPAGGLLISAYCVVDPAPLVNPTDEPKLPRRFRSGILDYAAAKGFGSEEDNAELRSFYAQEFDSKVAQLKLLRTGRQGRSVVQMQVEGVHY